MWTKTCQFITFYTNKLTIPALFNLATLLDYVKGVLIINI